MCVLYPHTLTFLSLFFSGEEPADLVDCRIGLHLLQLPSKTFWDGFENMAGELDWD